MNERRRWDGVFSTRRLTGSLWLLAFSSIGLLTLGCRPSSVDQAPVAGRVGDPLPALQPAAWINKDPQLASTGPLGKVMVIEAFATWCGPCRLMAPAMVQLRQEIDAQREESAPVEVEFISLTPEPAAELDAIRQFIADHGVKWPVGVGAESTLVALGTEGLPTVWVIGVDGRIVWRKAGWSGSADLVPLRAAIALALENQQPPASVPQ
ncbi:MAG: TlpA disulfide reductase family protein [Pirellulales bacterium]